MDRAHGIPGHCVARPVLVRMKLIEESLHGQRRSDFAARSTKSRSNQGMLAMRP
jgi:hypothetical protein